METGDSRRRDLYVAFEIKPTSGVDCPLEGVSEDVGEIRQHLVGDECHTDTTVYTDDCDCRDGQTCEEIVHTHTPIEESCACTVFGEFGCVPEIVTVSDGCAHIETYLPNRDRLQELVEALRAVTAGLHLRQLKRIDPERGGGTRSTATLNLGDVTDKQREAVTKAVAAGYYATPRETSFEELAAEMEISKSALSQRLNAAESKLATAAFARADGGR